MIPLPSRLHPTRRLRPRRLVSRRHGSARSRSPRPVATPQPPRSCRIMTLDRVLAANRRHRPADISRCRTGRPTRARPEFRLAEAPRGAEELGSMVVHRITALTPEQVSGGNNAPALRFAIRGEPGLRPRGPARTRTQGCRRRTLSVDLSEDAKRRVRAVLLHLRLGQGEQQSPGACGRASPRRPASGPGCRSRGGAATSVHTLLAAGRDDNRASQR